MQAASDSIKAERAAAEKQMAERQRQQTEDGRFAATLWLRRAASRQQYGATARAALARIATQVDAFTSSPEDQTQPAVHKYPGFAALFRNDLDDRWGS